MQIFGLVIISKRQAQLLKKGRKSIETQRLISKRIDKMLVNKEYDLTEGHISEHSPPNITGVNSYEYSKAANFYSIVYRQKLEEIKILLNARGIDPGT